MTDRRVQGHRHIVTDANRAKAFAMKELGIPDAKIAESLGIARSTLIALYGPDLARAAEYRRMATVLSLWEAARRGHVPSLIALIRIQHRVMMAEQRKPSP